MDMLLDIVHDDDWAVSCRKRGRISSMGGEDGGGVVGAV